MKMKVIDFDKRGNVIRLYFGEDEETEYWGDDFNDAPYEHNAGKVYDRYIKQVADFAFPFSFDVMEPADDWHYGGNSPFSKEDMIKRTTPCLIIVKGIDSWDICYSKYCASNDCEHVLPIYFEDRFEMIAERIKAFGGIVMSVKEYSKKVVQNPDSVGTALKTITMRLGAAKTESDD